MIDQITDTISRQNDDYFSLAIQINGETVFEIDQIDYFETHKPLELAQKMYQKGYDKGVEDAFRSINDL